MNRTTLIFTCAVVLMFLAFSVTPVHGQVTFNPTAKVALGGSQPGSVIGAGTMPQIVRTTTFFFNLRDDLPSSHTMSFDNGVLNMEAITLNTRLFETNIVISTTMLGTIATARIGYTVSSLTQDSATLVGTVEATTIDPAAGLFLRDILRFRDMSGVSLVMKELIGFVGIDSTLSVDAEGFSYNDSFNVPNDTISEDVQSFQIQAVVTDTFPADLYTTPQLAGTLTVSHELTSLTGLTSGPILDQFTVSESAPSETPSTVLVANFIIGNTDFFRSRVYLWNPSTSSGNITVRVFTMPRPAPSDPPDPSQLLGTLPLGTLESESARTIRIEEVLSALGITLPYTENGGNLMLEFTIEAEGVRGTAQVFNDSLTLAFGTYPLQVIQ